MSGKCRVRHLGYCVLSYSLGDRDELVDIRLVCLSLLPKMTRLTTVLFYQKPYKKFKNYAPSPLYKQILPAGLKDAVSTKGEGRKGEGLSDNEGDIDRHYHIMCLVVVV